MTITPDDYRIVYLPQTDVMTATGFCNILKDRWFFTHPETGNLIFWQDNKRRKGKLLGASPQCNSDEHIAKTLAKHTMPWAKIVFFERVAYPIDVNDY